MKKLKILFLSFCLLIFCSLNAHAESIKDDTFIYGKALNENQIETIRNIFKITDNVKTSYADSNDLRKYLNQDGNDYDMISSVYVKNLPKNSGIKVNIITPENITLITEKQYLNAAITAGISDLEINVASNSKVTGESALVGVYKAIELDGGKLDTNLTQTAQDELETVNIIVKENSQNKDFSKDRLNDAVNEIKVKLKEYKEHSGENADDQKITNIINTTINNYNLNDVLSHNNINMLKNYFQQYQKAGAVDNEAVKQNLKKISDSAKQIYEDNKSDIDRVYEKVKKSGLLDKIKQFFIDLIYSLKGKDNEGN